MPAADRASEVALNLLHFSELGQAVTVVTGNGIFEDRGILKPWAPPLFSALATNRALKIAFVTNRQIHENEIRAHQNVMQFAIPPLQDRDIRALMIATAPAFHSKPQILGDVVIKAIGGHPGIAKATTRLIAQKGALSLEHDMRDLFNIQDKVLGESLNMERISDVEADVLSVVSWIPQLNANTFKTVIVRRPVLTMNNLPTA